MYSELRRHRGIGQRGRLPPGNEDLLWLPRSAVVAALSSLDAYVHAVLYDQIPAVLKASPVPDALSNALATVIPIRNGATFNEALPVITASDVEGELTARLKSQSLAFLSYQAPEKIQLAYEMVAQPNIFGSVSALWPGPATSADDLKRVLSNYVRRRNQIAHEGDRELSGAVRHMQPLYADRCADFIENLVNRLNRVVYGV
jgi:hypothetical protein